MHLTSAIAKYFPFINSQFSQEEFTLFLSCRYVDMHKYHFGLGTWIRNSILSNDSALVALFTKCGFDNYDDMPAFIIGQFYIFSKSKELSDR